MTVELCHGGIMGWSKARSGTGEGSCKVVPVVVVDQRLWILMEVEPWTVAACSSLFLLNKLLSISRAVGPFEAVTDGSTCKMLPVVASGLSSFSGFASLFVWGVVIIHSVNPHQQSIWNQSGIGNCEGEDAYFVMFTYTFQDWLWIDSWQHAMH